MNRIKFADKHGQKQRHYYTRASSCATQRGIVTPFAPGTVEFSPPRDNPPTEHHQHHRHPQKLLHFNVGFIMANKYFTIRLPVRRTALESNIVPGHRDGRGKEPTQSAEIHRQQRHQGSGYL